MPLPFTAQAQWIWSAEGSHAAPAPADASPSHYQVRLFRRTLEAARPGDLPPRIHVSADSRYVLWCNGALVGRGPATTPASLPGLAAAVDALAAPGAVALVVAPCELGGGAAAAVFGGVS